MFIFKGSMYENAHDVLREEKKQSVHIVSEELENLEGTPQTIESLFEEFQPIVSVVLEFPMGVSVLSR